VGVVTLIGIVFDVGSGDCNTSLPLFGRLVDGAIIEIFRVALFCLSLRDCCCEGCLAVINVTNCACKSLELLRDIHTMPLFDIPMLT
jgi:hypothetical protein